MKTENTPSAFENVFEWLNWLKIVLSPTLFFGGIALALKIYLNNTTGDLLFSFILLFGILSGILWANSIKKKYGTTHFISRTNASPDIDKMIKEDKKIPPKI